MDALSIDRRGPFTTAGHVDDRALDAALFRDLASDPASESAVGCSAAWARSSPRASSTNACTSSRVSRTRAAMSPTPCPGSSNVRRGATPSVPGLVRVRRARAHPVVRGRVQRHRGRPVRALRRRRRRGHLLRDLHGVRRRRRSASSSSRRRTSEVHVVAPARSRRREQGPGALPPADRRPLHALSRHDGEPTPSPDLRRHAALADRRPLDGRRSRRGAVSRSATAARRSSSTRDGWC